MPSSSLVSKSGLVVGALVLLIAGIVLASVFAIGALRDLGTSTGAGDTLDNATRVGVLDGYDADQLENARTIMRVATESGLDERAQIVGVMTAMGESSLRNIGYGDWESSGVRNPDGSATSSLGLFQQQDWWGSEEERLDPATAAKRFFEVLTEVDGWEDMRPTLAANAVQGNDDPHHYEPYERGATELVQALRTVA
ncbi:peptidase M23 [Pseudoclavibacter chungangensis]|uniref:Peptidase M23 n=1 Tax=Pseudoclavibacter chungangensis TaxID=587635 RepID=A0A7J5C419_9MICO|nr:peptidase M23 [Pseudoclavibacter chungangensis]KAB1662530.1 peptidase M23 [Pseudoclavibacter chungangensis]NYJ68569.1 hypothetical protein [Pseudoclavibacter chungangensis]